MRAYPFGDWARLLIGIGSLQRSTIRQRNDHPGLPTTKVLEGRWHMNIAAQINWYVYSNGVPS